MPTAKRQCSKPGCPATAVAGPRCADHPRPNATARGYDTNHRKLRQRWAPRVATGQVKCWRCSQTISPTEAWDLGHRDDGSYGGPEHAGQCNRAAAGRASHIN